MEYSNSDPDARGAYRHRKSESERNTAGSLYDSSSSSNESIAHSLRETNYRASNHYRLVRIIKPSFLPLLMWPTRPPGTTIGARFRHVQGDLNTNYSEGKGPINGPPRTPNPRENIASHDSDMSMIEVLKRIYTSLFADSSEFHVLLFTKMEVASRKDAIYSILPIPLAPGKKTTADTNDTIETVDTNGTTGM
jgi:hypothetical protein